MTNEFKELARHAAHGTAPANFEVANVDEAFREELSKYCSSIPQFMKNRYDLYEIIMENADEIVPKKVLEQIGMFAEIKNIPQGAKAIFKLKKGKTRAKRFLTQVGLSGVYETFRLDTDTVELNVKAYGGAATLDFERMLDGDENLADVMDILAEGLTESVFGEIQGMLKSAYANLKMPAANKHSNNAWDPAQMLKICNTVRAYGQPVIFATPEFVASMGPDAVVAGTANVQGVYAPQDIEAIHNTGFINMFRGVPVVIIPQSFTDIDNVTKVIDPQYAYVLPSTGEKVVKVAFEGNTQMNDFKNRDNSLEIHVYKKFGVGILSYHNWGIYRNTSLS